MVLLAVTSALLLSAAEPSGTALVLARRTNISSADASALAASVSAVLRDLEVPLALDADASTMKLAKLGLQDPGTCAGRRSCIVELGGLLGVAWVIGVSVSQIDADRSVALELIRISDQAVVAKDAIILAGKTKLSGALLSDFAVRCRAALKKPIADAPVAVKVVPQKPPPPPPLPSPPVVQSRSHATSWALGGGAVVAVAGAAVLFGLAMSTRAELSRGTRAGDLVQSELLGSQALAKNDTANLELGLAAAAAGVGIGLGTAAVLTW